MADASATLDSTNSSIKGICFLVFGISIFTIQDVIIKQLSGAYPATEIVFIRCIIALIPAYLLIQYEGGSRLFKTDRPFLLILRGLLGFTSYTTYYLALAALSLADVVTLFYSSPLFVTALSVVFLKESVGIRRWFAVLVGFAGVLVVANPGGGSFDPAMLFAVGAAISYAFMVLLTRGLARHAAGSTMTFYSMLAFIGASGIFGLLLGDGSLAAAYPHPSTQFLLRAWVIPSGADMAWLAVIGMIAGIGFYCLTQAYRIGSASVVAPFEYSSLPWAILWGWLFWSDLPSAATYMGILLIVGSGLYIIHRESVKGHRLVRGRTLRNRF